MQRAHARADVVPCGSSGAASRPEASAASAMEHDDHERPSRGIKLPDFPGEQGQLRSHDGRIWKQSAITILAPFGLVITAMTGVPPRVAEIIDTDVDSIPEFQPGHPEYASNTQRHPPQHANPA